MFMSWHCHVHVKFSACTWPIAQCYKYYHMDGLVQDCNNSIANALELLQSSTKPTISNSFSILLWNARKEALHFNSLGLSEAIWHRRSWSLVQVMACWRHQAITWTNVDLSSVRSCGIHLRTLSKEDLKIPISKARLKITLLKPH